jgi:hypothetical protein
MKYIENARHAWKLFSLQIAAVWASVFGIIAADPMLFVTAWNAIPAELREFLPPWVRWLVVASAMFGTIYLARVVKQKPLAPPKEPEEETRV